MSKPDIIGPANVKENDKIIALIGLTGCGKSNFIDHVTKSTKWASHGLGSAARDVRAVRIQLFNTNVVLVDTPGFDPDDSYRSDIAILELLGEWLNKTYAKDIKLTGILHLHRITDIHMISGTTFRNLRMFGKLCGDNPASKVIFVTTMWDQTSTRQGEQGHWQDEQQGKQRQQRERREQELFNNYWRSMLELGARTDRFLQNKENCAQDIIKRLLDHTASEANPTLLQEETMDQDGANVEMEAAKAVYSQMQTLFSQYKAGLAELQEAAKKTNNPQMLADLQKEEARIQSELDKTFADARKLKLSIWRRMQLFFARGANGHSINFSLGGNDP